MSQEFKSELWGYVRRPHEPPVLFPDIALISQATVDFFNAIYDDGAYERLFKPWDAAGRTYRLWSFYANKPDGTQQIRADLDMLIASYPQDFGVLGAWNWTTGQEVGAAQGEPWYPIPHQTLNFMPDVIVDPEVDPPEMAPATELTDVVLVLGQHARDFTSYVPNTTDTNCPDVGAA